MSAAAPALLSLAARRAGARHDRAQVDNALRGSRLGYVSVCSAHALVLEATLRHAARHGRTALIEATCNQVNHQGGYTGLSPAAFRDRVQDMASQAGLPPGPLLLGGDHLGPNPWRDRPAAEAMNQAATMVAAYAEAGFAKLHLDCSMGCAGEPDAVGDAVAAERSARLAVVAETAAQRAGREPPVYVIGTEVPPPGGAHGSGLDLQVTDPAAARATLEAHEAAFRDAGVPGAFERVVALVVQPGVEFGDRNVAVYRPERAAALAASLAVMPGLVFEAHSTDYQPAEALAALVRDGFAILKVGPALTFALREALYALDAIRGRLAARAGGPSGGEAGGTDLRDAMEALMLADPRHWRAHYSGTPAELAQLRHTGLSDRIRYYWAAPEAEAAVAALLSDLDRVVRDGHGIPPGLAAELLPGIPVSDRPAPREIVLRAVEAVLDLYSAAAGDPDAAPTSWG